MRAGVRLAAVGLWCLVGVFVGVAPALGEGPPSSPVAPVEGAGASASLGGPLVTPESPSAGEELQAAHEATLASPEAVAAREASRTQFEGLGPEQARAEAAAAFPSAIEQQAGGPPPLPAGQKVVGFDEPDVAEIDLGGGQAGIVESNVPMATKTASGGYTPVDLSLNDTGAAFEPANPLVSVSIPKHLGEGVQLPVSGISLTPVRGPDFSGHGPALTVTDIQSTKLLNAERICAQKLVSGTSSAPSKGSTIEVGNAG